MDVKREPFLDRSEPKLDGSYDFRYEGEQIVFQFDDERSLRARRYADAPTEATLYFDENGPTEDDAETHEAVAWLRDAGVATVKVLGGSVGGYRPIWTVE